MAKINNNYRKLSAGYLFPEISRRVAKFQQENPQAIIYRLGIGNTTEPLTPVVIEGLKYGVERLSSPETYSGYGDEQGDLNLREALAQLYRQRGVSLEGGRCGW